MATAQIPQISASTRDRLGTRYAARLRESGKLPAVIYGHKQDPVHVAVDEKQLVGILHSNAHLIEVQLDGHTEPCLVKDVQWNHLGSRIIHIDLARVDLNERVTVEVDLKFTGQAIGLKQTGAILEHPLNSLEIECLATQIPDHITVDVSALDVDQSITVADLKLPDGVTTEQDPETVVATVTIVQEEVEPEATTEGAAEPEVIGRKPEEGDEEDTK